MLSPLAELAGRYNVAVLAVTHLAKGMGGKAVYRSMGSLAFTAASRAVWAVTKDADDPTRRLLLPVKMNLCAENTGLAFTIVDEHIRWDQTPVCMTADDALAAETGKNNEESSVLEDAKTWLQDTLSCGSVPAKELRKRAREDGLSWRTVERAKSVLGVDARKEGFGPGHPWVWRLPKSADAAGPPP